MKSNALTLTLLVGIWSVAATGIAVKLALPRRFDQCSIGIYLVAACCSTSAACRSRMRCSLSC
jgi:predicted membrane channel-forming protein YqfA (hemolysin III family)